MLIMRYFIANAKKRIPLFLFLFFIGFSFCLYAQKIKVKDIPHIDKLPINVINTIFQDSEGYMWYGTEDGLCRDDGYNIHTFRSDFKNPDIMLSNTITCLAEDSIMHHIWIGTTQGLYILDKRTYTISPVKTADLGKGNIDAINVTADHSIWVSVYRKIVRLDANGAILKSYPLQCTYGPGKEFVLYEDRKHQLLLSISGKGLYKWDSQTDQFQLFFPYKDRINAIIQDKEHDYYWLASWEHAIIRFDPLNSSEDLRYIYQPFPRTSVGQTAKTSLNLVQDDTYGYVWVTSWSDLFAYQVTSDGMLEQVDTSSFLPCRNKALQGIIKDKKGDLWITARDNNNFIINFDEDNLSRYNIAALEERTKWMPTVVSFCKDEKGVFWFFQRRLGLCIYQPEKDKIRCYTDFNITRGQSFLVLSCLLKSTKKGLVWVVAQNSSNVYGMSQKDMEMKVDCKIELSAVSKNSDPITFLYEDKYDNLWIATKNALFVYHINERKLESVPNALGNVTYMTQMEDGVIWGIVKNKGLVRIDQTMQSEILAFQEDFLCIAAANEQLWLGTNKGEVLLFNPKTEAVENYSMICGMNGDRINDIIVDRYNHIWIVTSQEIKEFNPRNGAYRSFLASNKNIDINRFLPQSVYKAPDGQLYFGGVSGIMSILPSQHLESVSQQIKPLITNVKIMGHSVFFDTKRNGESLDVINIYPEEQNLEIQFSSLDYQNTSRIRYAYRLAGVDNEWIYLPTGRNTAFYNKLSKGKYVFYLKTTDKNGLWSDHITKITIHRLPALYETWWAYAIYVLLVLLMAWYAYRLMRNRIRLRNALHLHKLEQAKAEEINHAKLQFFTNITHELLTPLTILSASVEELKQIAPAYKGQYKVMTNNINRLIRLLQQILEFRKAETGNLKLRVSQGDLASFVQSSVDGFLPLIKKKGMQFIVTCQPKPFMAFYDTDKLDKIIYNLLSNAAKYSLPNETVHVELFRHPENDNFVQLVIKDNGPGISKEAQKELFKRFYEGSYRKFNAIGTGIGLSLVNDLVKLHHGTITVESKEGCGTSFTVSLPFEKSAYAPEEIDIDILPETQESVDNIAEASVSGGEEEDVEEETLLRKQEQKYSLLLVEDNEDLLQLMVRLLSVEYIVYTAKDGKEGIAVIEQNDVDLIVSDVMMPVMDGIEFCKYVKSNFDTSHIPVIMLTAKNQEEDRVEAYESGADGFISKPFSLSVLHARIVNLLSTRERMTKNFKKQLVFEAQELNYTSLDEEFLQQAIACVHRHLDDPDFDQTQFVEELHTTKSTSFRKLKSLTGLSFSSFVRNIRMKAACQIMEEKKQVKISEVAYAVGYNDPRYFTNCFKKEIGMMPGEYLEKFVSK